MHQARRSLFDRFRAGRQLPAMLLLWLFLSAAGAGVHLASHLTEAFGAGGGIGSAPQDRGEGDSAEAYSDCQACRLIGSLSLALGPRDERALHDRRDDRTAQPPIGAAAAATDLVARWRQRLKHGPPVRSR